MPCSRADISPQPTQAISCRGAAGLRPLSLCRGAAGLRPTCLRVLSPPALSPPAPLLKRLLLDTGRERLPAMVGGVGQAMRGMVARVMMAVMTRVCGGRG
ncbi:MAG: hypothetical protein M3Y81_28155 [Chloroflexota bacterium]|nr:hypothetical protein [Chloroflexota bacterium]